MIKNKPVLACRYIFFDLHLVINYLSVAGFTAFELKINIYVLNDDIKSRHIHCNLTQPIKLTVRKKNLNNQIELLDFKGYAGLGKKKAI